MTKPVEEVAEDNERLDEGGAGTYIIGAKDEDPEIRSYNQGGYDFTRVPLSIVLAWVRKNRPELLK